MRASKGPSAFPLRIFRQRLRTLNSSSWLTYAIAGTEFTYYYCSTLHRGRRSRCDVRYVSWELEGGGGGRDCASASAFAPGVFFFVFWGPGLRWDHAIFMVFLMTPTTRRLVLQQRKHYTCSCFGLFFFSLLTVLGSPYPNIAGMYGFFFWPFFFRLILPK